MSKLPKEFIELNTIVKEFNTGNNVSLFGENKYLLLQGNRVKGYSLWICEGNIGEGRLYQALVLCNNRRGILEILEVLNRLSQSPLSVNRSAKFIALGKF